MFFYSVAHAADVIPATPSALSGALPLIVMAAIFYFLLIRPQQKKYKQHQQLVAGLRRGDQIVTSGGIIGTISKVDNEGDILHVEIADDVKVKVVRGTVSSLASRAGDSASKTEEKK